MSKSSNSFLLAGLLAVSMLPGCNRKSQDGGETKSQAQSAAANPAPADSAVPKADSIRVSFDVPLEGYKASELGKAIHSGSLEEFKRLIQAGSPPAKCLTDETYVFDALYAALAFGQRAIAEYILQNRLYEDINKVYTEESETPLTLACAIPSAEDALGISRELLARGANANGAGSSGGENTLYPLIIAVKRNHAELVKLLLEKGAAKDVADNSGTSPLSVAKDSGFTEIANMLGSQEAE